MPLLKPRTRTPTMVAANRRNALKSTGPRTPIGKARVALNALKHGRYAVALRDKIIRTGDHEADQHYRWLRSEIAHTFLPRDPSSRREVERLANRVWALGRQKCGTKPISVSLSEGPVSWHGFLSPSQPHRYRIVDRYRLVGIVFWVQRRRYWTRKRLLAWYLGALGVSKPVEKAGEVVGGAEQAWRSRRFQVEEPLGPWARQIWEAEKRRLMARAARAEAGWGAIRR